MRDDIINPKELLEAEYQDQLARLREELAAATTWRKRFKVRRGMLRLRRHKVNRQIISW